MEKEIDQVIIYVDSDSDVSDSEGTNTMEGRKGHNSVLLFKLQFKHLYIRIYYFVTFIILVVSLSFYHSN